MSIKMKKLGLSAAKLRNARSFARQSILQNCRSIEYRCIPRLKIKVLFISLVVPLFFSCSNPCTDDEEKLQTADCPVEISARAFKFAELYRDTETEYAWGGQDLVRAVKIDCSGLVVMCYKYAVTDTAYCLLFNDATADGIYKNYSTLTETPRTGDLIFMGEENSTAITHIAIFDKEENGYIYFIDSTQKDTDGDGINDINGVSERHYSKSDAKIKAYGIMKLKK